MRESRIVVYTMFIHSMVATCSISAGASRPWHVDSSSWYTYAYTCIYNDEDSGYMYTRKCKFSSLRHGVSLIPINVNAAQLSSRRFSQNLYSLIKIQRKTHPNSLLSRPWSTLLLSPMFVS